MLTGWADLAPWRRHVNKPFVMVTPCPLCHVSLDAYQPRAKQLHNSAVNMPVVHLSQLVGLACGIDPGNLQLNRLMVSPQRALATVLSD